MPEPNAIPGSLTTTFNRLAGDGKIDNADYRALMTGVGAPVELSELMQASALAMTAIHTHGEQPSEMAQKLKDDLAQRYSEEHSRLGAFIDRVRDFFN